MYHVGAAIPFFSIGVKAIKGVISAASGVNDSLGKSKELRQAVRLLLLCGPMLVTLLLCGQMLVLVIAADV